MSEFHEAIKYALTQLASQKQQRAQLLWERMRNYAHPQQELPL